MEKKGNVAVVPEDVVRKNVCERNVYELRVKWVVREEIGEMV